MLELIKSPKAPKYGSGLAVKKNEFCSQLSGAMKKGVRLSIHS
jgi:hypothetical protein